MVFYSSRPQQNSTKTESDPTKSSSDQPFSEPKTPTDEQDKKDTGIFSKLKSMFN